MNKRMDFDNNTNAGICIVSRDTAFAQLLAYEASKIGIGADIKSSPSDVDDMPYQLLIIDLDDFAQYLPLSKGMLTLGYSVRYYEDGLIELGKLCDAVLHKPFLMSDYRDILTRFTSASRERAKTRTDATSENQMRIYLDSIKREAVVCGEIVSLSEKEYDALSLLLENRGRATSRAELALAIGCEGNMQEVDVYICYLRRKIDERLNLKFIRTVRGVGYEIR